jgi:subtilisin family serine protease/PKD repeat protein
MTKRTVPYRLMLLITIFLLQIFIFPLPRSGIISEALAINGSENRAYAQAEFVPDEIIVKFKEGISEQRRNAILSEHNTTIKSINRRVGFIQLKVHGRVRSIRALVGSFENYKEVEYAEPNYLVHTSLSPNDPNYPQLWGLNNIGQTGGLQDADIDAPESWDIQTGLPLIIIAVIDTGIDYDHEDLSYNMWINLGEIPGNGIDDDDNGYIDDVHGWDFVNGDNDPIDDNSHGTHCAGIIAAEGNNGIGVVGVNWTATIMPLKSLNAEGSGTTTDAILAIQYATQMGAEIMSNSWGGYGYSQALKDAITATHEAGAVFIAAAGNNAQNNDVIPHYPSSYDVPNIISVAATDHNDELALFSNYGPNSVDLGAPGVSILSTFLNDGYGYKSGTSMATPHVAGSAGLLWAEYPDLTNDEIKAGILDAVDKMPALAGKTVTEGRLNAYSALIGVVPPPPPVPITVFQDDMESGVNGWTVSGGCLWHQSTHRSVSPDTSWYYGIEETYTYNTGDRNFGSLTSSPIDLTDITSNRLVFSHFLNTENYPPHDTATVQITKDGGMTYTDIYSKTTTDGAFIEENLDISEFDDCVIQVRFFFDTLDEKFNNFEGWYIDNVIVKGETTGPVSNQPPVADAGPDQTVSDDDGNGVESVVLDGSGSYDPDGEIVSYEWKEGEVLLGTGMTITYDFTVAGSPHTVTLRVTDDEGESAADEVIIIVNANQPPVADAGPDLSAYTGDTVTFDGSGSDDADGEIVSYDWDFGDGSPHGTDVIASHVYSAAGTYNVTLTVTDNGGLTDTDNCTATISEQASDTMHVGDISMSLTDKKRGKNIFTYATATITIMDAFDSPVEGAATVSGHWSGLTQDTDSGTTGVDGKVSLNSDQVKNASGIFTFTVDDVALDDWTYDPSANKETSGSITR